MYALVRAPAVLYALISALIAPVAAAEIAATATEVSQKMLDRYAALRAYSDVSLVEARLAGVSLRGRISTWYVTPDATLVRIETERTPTQLFEADDGNYRSWTGKRGWKSYRESGAFFGALKGSTAILGRSPHWILSLYFPDETLGKSLRDYLSASHRVTDEIIGGIKCHRLEIKVDETRMMLWIGATDYLLHKIQLEEPSISAVVLITPTADPPFSKEDLKKQAQRLSSR